MAKELLNTKVYVVIEAKTVEYHGCFHEIVEIYANKEDAEKKVKELSEGNYNCDIEYYIDTYSVE